MTLLRKHKEQEKNIIKLEIKNQPYGMQNEKDNWIFLINTILGYLWLVDRDFKVERVAEGYKKLDVTYAK